jgi:hypothetical protein
MAPPPLRDDLFDSPRGDWVDTYTDEHFKQRELQKSDLIYCETLMSVSNPDLEAAAALIMGPWDWWEHGRITDYRLNPDGSSDQTLAPVWWFITRVGLHIWPPVGLAGFTGKRMALMLTGHFEGPSSMDVYAHPRGDGIIVRGRFHGVEYKMPAVPDKLAERLHLGAESGTMPLPFPKGTGWVGLRRMLETRGVVGIQSGNEKIRSGRSGRRLTHSRNDARGGAGG